MDDQLEHVEMLSDQLSGARRKGICPGESGYVNPFRVLSLRHFSTRKGFNKDMKNTIFQEQLLKISFTKIERDQTENSEKVNKGLTTTKRKRSTRLDPDASCITRLEGLVGRVLTYFRYGSDLASNNLEGRRTPLFLMLKMPHFPAKKDKRYVLEGTGVVACTCKEGSVLISITSLLKILKRLSFSRQIHLQWIPSHTNIAGNEIAHSLARAGTGETTTPAASLINLELFFKAGLGSKSSIGVGLLQGEWTHGSDLPLLISGMRNNNMISLAFISLGGLPLSQGNPPRPWVLGVAGRQVNFFDAHLDRLQVRGQSTRNNRLN
ncbi:hypothetical protein TNCV_4514201 [Trichonephila clavipes]|nr:hypothetical protein TNCV_4514201 [Trichonephila clavipes]